MGPIQQQQNLKAWEFMCVFSSFNWIYIQSPSQCVAYGSIMFSPNVYLMFITSVGCLSTFKPNMWIDDDKRPIYIYIYIGKICILKIQFSTTTKYTFNYIFPSIVNYE